MKLFTFLLGALLTLQPAYGQKSPRVVAEEDETTIYIGKQAVLTYVHKETLPPSGVDTVYKRSAYIHPLNSPGGERLTRIQAPDHWHHYGIWNPWTRTHFGEYKVDFWNLAERQGTVRFAEYLEKIELENQAGFRVRQLDRLIPGYLLALGCIPANAEESATANKDVLTEDYRLKFENLDSILSAV